MNKIFYNFLLSIFIILIGMVGVTTLIGMFKTASIKPHETYIEEINCVEPIQYFGYSNDDYYFEKHLIKPNQYLSEILIYQGVDFSKIDQLARKSQEIFNVRKFRSGKHITFIKPDICSNPVAFAYEPDPMHYVLFMLDEQTEISIIEREITRQYEHKQGIIESSLWDAMVADNISLDVIDLMEDALGSSVDFYHIQKGDRFKLIYEQLYVGNKRVGLGKLKGAVFQNDIGKYFAIYYEGNKYKGFFNQDAIPNKRSFLKSPVRASRISSRFNRRRRHPVLKRIKAHLGTDYAAPYGTPIRAVASGVIIKRSRSRNNGNYIKIKHDKLYSTQYLHMQSFGKAKVGNSVAQGDIIGYVGSTGLATGPHVCFRFWKNGRQVNHLRENFPTPDPIDKTELDAFYQVRDSVVLELNVIGQTMDSDRPIVL